MADLSHHLRVLEALQAEPLLSRPDLARLSGLSRPTVAAVVDDLVAAGVLAEHPAGEAAPAGRRRAGRPPRLVGVVPRAAFAVGLEVERDHVGWVVCDLAGAPVAGGRRAIPPDAAAADSVALLGTLVDEGLAAAGLDRARVLGTGAALAAPIDRPGGVVHAQGLLPGWAGVDAQAALEARFGAPVLLANDANAGALGEHAAGAGAGVDDLVYVRLSTGVGAGIVAGGQVYSGGAGMAGEIGHLTVADDGPICRCGNRGCLEAVAGPVALARLLERSTGAPVDVDRLVALVVAGDRGATRVVADAGEHIGRAIAATVNVVNPRVVVLGGELAAAGDTLVRAVRRAIDRHASPPVAATVEVRTGALGDRAEVLGAAALVLAGAPRRLVARMGEAAATGSAAA